MIANREPANARRIMSSRYQTHRNKLAETDAQKTRRFGQSAPRTTDPRRFSCMGLDTSSLRRAQMSTPKPSSTGLRRLNKIVQAAERPGTPVCSRRVGVVIELPEVKAAGSYGTGH
jgi:hypothetical protein